MERRARGRNHRAAPAYGGRCPPHPACVAGDLRLRAGHDDVRNANGCALPYRAEIGVDVTRATDRINERIRARVDGRARYVRIPRIVGWKHGKRTLLV